MYNFSKYTSGTLAFKGYLRGTSAFGSWLLVSKKIFRILIRSVLLYLRARVGSTGAGALAWLGALTWLEAEVLFSGAPSLSDLLSNLEAGGTEAAALQEQEPCFTTEVALQKPDIDAICLICLIDWAFPNRLADPLGLEQLKL